MCLFFAKSIKRRWSVIFCGPSTHKMFEGAMRHDAAAHVRRGKRLRPFYGLNSLGTPVVLRRECSLRVEQIEPVKRRSSCREGIGSLSRVRDFLPVCFYIQTRSDRFGSSRYMYLNPIRPAAVVKFVNSLDGTKAFFNNCFARVVEQACRVSFCEKK